MLKKLKNMFTSKKNDDKNENANIPEPNAINEEENVVQDAIETATENQNLNMSNNNEQENAIQAPASSNTFSDISKSLNTSQKGGRGKTSSSEYQGVLDCLKSLNELTNLSFSNEYSKNYKLLFSMFQAHGKLLASCDTYLSKSRSFTDAGRHRKAVVSTLRNMLEADMPGLAGMMERMHSLPLKEQASLTWEAIYKESRTRKIKIDNINNLKKASGGVISSVLTIDSNESNGVSGFFKESENITNFFGKKEQNKLEAQESFAKTIEKFPLNDKLYKKVKDCLYPVSLENRLRAGEIDDINFEEKKTLTKFQKTWENQHESYRRMKDQLDDVGAGIDKGAKYKFQERNIATSRIANLLGLQGLVVNSELAEISYAEGGETKTKQGLLMSAAEGTAAGKTKPSGRRFAAVNGNEKFESIESESYGYAFSDVTNNFQREMSNLDILDYVCGQDDRHEGNFFVKKDENGKFDGVVGIDNDSAFGKGRNENKELIEANEKAYDNHEFGGGTKTGRSKGVISKGKLVQPHIDAELAERVLTIDKDMIKYTLMDLIEPQNIEACWLRLQQLQKAINHAKSKTPDKLIKPDDWGAKTHDKSADYTNGKETYKHGEITTYALFMTPNFYNVNMAKADDASQAEFYNNIMYAKLIREMREEHDKYEK